MRRLYQANLTKLNYHTVAKEVCVDQGRNILARNSTRFSYKTLVELEMHVNKCKITYHICDTAALRKTRQKQCSSHNLIKANRCL